MNDIHCDLDDNDDAQTDDSLKIDEAEIQPYEFLPEELQADDLDDTESDVSAGNVVYPRHDPNETWMNMKPILGMRFESPEQLKHMLTNYAVANGYALYYERNDYRKVLCRCGKDLNEVKCPFRLWASWMADEKSFQIKTLTPNHNCSRKLSLGSIVTYHWIAKNYFRTFMENPKLTLRGLIVDVREKYNVNITVGQARKAKEKAMSIIEGKISDHYSRLWDYGAELKRSNPGSTVSVEVNCMPDGVNYFSSFYVCLKALKDGWLEGCRKVIGLDGAFLKGMCKGELLSAVGRDANNQMFPIAWAIVCVENKANWKWFLDLLKDDLHLDEGFGVTLISDQHKGLIEAVKETLPRVEHRQCARHIYANFKKQFNGQL